MPVVGGHAELEKLTRRHGVKLLSGGGFSVEEASYAVGEAVGFDSVKSASRMNGAIVIFLDQVNKVEQVVEEGVVIRGTFTPVLPLSNPAKKVMISNAPPFIKNEDLAKELSRYGQLVSPIKMVLLGCKSSQLKHVVCHRRQVFMLLKDSSKDLNLTFSFRVDGFNYNVFATSETMKCFGCGAEGHLVRACPEAGARHTGGGSAPSSGGSAPSSGGAAAPPSGGSVSSSGGEALSSGGAAAPVSGVSTELPAGPSAGPDESGALRPAVGSGSSRAAEVVRDGAADVEDGELNVTQDQGKKVKNVNIVQSSEKAGKTKQAEKEKCKENVESCSAVMNDVQIDDESMCEDDVVNKSNKRKNLDKEQSSSKAKKVQEDLSDEECEWTPSQEESIVCYSLEKIKKFLLETKGQRVKIDQFFPDLRGFVKSVMRLRKEEDAFSEQEVYRLKKMVTKVKTQLIEDDD